jgi:chorismate mutase-like protein
MNIQQLRKNIDELDKNLMNVLIQRKKLVQEVAEYKKFHQLPPLDPSRWQEVLDTRTEWAIELGLDPEFVVDLFNRIHEYALQIEGEICHK